MISGGHSFIDSISYVVFAVYVVVTNVPFTLNCTFSAVFIGVGVAAAIPVAFVVLNLISLKSKFLPISSNRSFALISIASVFGSYVVHNPTPFVTLNRFVRCFDFLEQLPQLHNAFDRHKNFQHLRLEYLTYH